MSRLTLPLCIQRKYGSFPLEISNRLLVIRLAGGGEWDGLFRLDGTYLYALMLRPARSFGSTTTGGPHVAPTISPTARSTCRENFGTMYAFDGQTGSVIWQTSVGSSVQSSPAVFNGVLYFGAYDNNVMPSMPRPERSYGRMRPETMLSPPRQWSMVWSMLDQTTITSTP